MKKNLLTAGLLSLSISAGAQVVSTVDNGGVFFVGENALVYNGGGMQTRGTGQYDIRGNMMVVGGGTDRIQTLNLAGGNKTDGGNIVLRLNNPAGYMSSAYGQLYIQGLAQAYITGIVDKEYRNARHGSYQQIALPFHQKAIPTLNTEFGKTFLNSRWSQDEILTWNNAKARSDYFDANGVSTKSTAYYMLGAKGLDTSNPPAVMNEVYTLKGVPVANGVSELLANAAKDISFGPEGNYVNYYGETYHSYLQDMWVSQQNPTNPWASPAYGREIYQFGNPYLTNLDLKYIGTDETGGLSDGNALKTVWGVRYDPGTVVTDGTGTYSVAAQQITFTPETGIPTGDVGLIVKPMQTFVIKFRDNNTTAANRTLSFDGLRRFKNTPRGANINNGVTAGRGGAVATVKQLGVIGLDENGNEIGRTYYVVYPEAISGNTPQPTAQVGTVETNIIGTYEEDPVNGGADTNFTNLYWLYINEANENDFKGKPILMELYENKIKHLKFELRENADLAEDGKHVLSSGIGFYYKAQNGDLQEITQNAVVPATVDAYNLFYGKPGSVLATDSAAKISRTKVIFSKSEDGFFVRFDPTWKKADVQVFDMSGKLVISQKQINADNDYPLQLQKMNSAYIVTAVSETGEKISTKIIR